MKEELKSSEVTFDERLVPQPNCDINIFISHGGRNGSAGFSGLYPADGKAYDVRKVFGKGKVAILFVCHAGSIVENHYSNSNHTLVKQLLNDGYESVISPSWSLNIYIPGIWAKEFIRNLNGGKNISESVYEANSIISSVYLSPSASCAMHLFGNRNIKRA